MSYGGGMSTPASLIESIGVHRLRAKLGVGETAILNAKKKPLLPGRWYAPVKELREEDGRDCPIELFNWSSPTTKRKKRAAVAEAQP